MPIVPPKRQVSDAENKLRLLCCVDALGTATPAQLWSFVASLELMGYVPMQLLLHELIAGGDLVKGENALQDQLFLTPQGHKAFALFDKRIMASDRRQIKEAAPAYRAELRRRAQVHAAYEIAKPGEYRVVLSLQEGELPLLTLRIATSNRNCADKAIHCFEGQAAAILALLYAIDISTEPAMPLAATLQSHSMYEHTVTALLPHPQAEITLSLLLPDAHAAEAYQAVLSDPDGRREIAKQLLALLCGEMEE